MAGISREYLNRMETGKVRPSKQVKDKITEALEKFNPDNLLTMLFDYVRIRFPTTDVQHVIHDILKLNIKYMLHEDYGHYTYTEHYYISRTLKVWRLIYSHSLQGFPLGTAKNSPYLEKLSVPWLKVRQEGFFM